MTQSYQLSVVTVVDEDFIKEWKALWDRAENATIFNSYEWFISCVETYKLPHYQICRCYYKNRLVAVLPLSTYRRYGIRVTGSICNNVLCHTSFLLEKLDTRLVRKFFSFILSRNTLFLNKVDEKAVTLLHTIFPTMFFSLMSVNATVDFRNDPIPAISKTTRRQIKHILNTHMLHFTLYDHTDDLNRQLETIFSVEQKSAKKLRSLDIFSDEKNREFYKNVTKNCSRWVQIGILYRYDEPISYLYSFVCRDVYVGYHTAYLSEYRELRPGKTLFFRLIETLKGTTIRELDLGGGLTQYKEEFTRKYRILYDVYYSSNIFIMAWWKCVNTAGRIKKLLIKEKHSKDPLFIFKPFGKVTSTI